MKYQPVSNTINYLILLSSLLAGYFALADLQISISFINTKAAWAIFLEKYGEIPGLLVLLAGIHLYLSHSGSSRKIKIGIITIILFLATLFISGYITFVIVQGSGGSMEFLMEYSVLIIAGLSVLNLSVLLILSKRKLTENVIIFSKITVLLGLYGYLFLVQPFKIFWGRIRFRDLDSLYASFTSWFIPNGITGNESFPSGHSAMGWMLLPLLILVNKSKIKQHILLVLISLWALTVGISRVVIGAHFASDVLFGALFIIITYIFLTKYYVQE